MPPLISLRGARSFTTRVPCDLPFSFFSMASLLLRRDAGAPVAYGMPDGNARNTARFAEVAMSGPGRHASRLSPRQGTVPDAQDVLAEGRLRTRTARNIPVADAPARRDSLRPHDLSARV